MKNRIIKLCLLLTVMAFTATTVEAQARKNLSGKPPSGLPRRKALPTAVRTNLLQQLHLRRLIP